MLHKSGMMNDHSTFRLYLFLKAGQPERQGEATLVYLLPVSQVALVCLFI